MTSILTNIAAMSALQTLRSIGQDMEATQGRVSSGLRVATASDNAAYWSIATTMRSDNGALSAVQDALGLGAAKVDTAYSGMESAVEVVKQIKNKLVAATEDGVDKTKIQEEITQLQQQLTSISEAASFSGENWLKADIGTTANVVASFVRDDSGAVSVKKVGYDFTANNVLFDTSAGAKAGILDKLNNIEGDGVVLNINTGGTEAAHNVVKYTTQQVIAAGATFDANGNVAWTTASDGSAAGAGVGYVKINDDTWVAAVEKGTATVNQEVAATGTSTHAWVVNTTNTAASTNQTSVSTFTITAATTENQLNNLISVVDTALKTMTSAASDLGSIKMRIDLQENFVSKLTDSIDKGIGRLVDADMNEESTKLKALQTQQQLAIQSLSIANSSSESILSLFRQ
ncbi:MULTISPECIES: flagellin [Agrobacterium]|uniref:Flagellin n=1 Tax=Agrobacterium tumefaciens TaxID=358 RepID=A0AAE6EDT8_AGRTU|nr:MULTISPECIES: flagellin [Agrobacterium]QCL72270.1 flagellin [Agrobacterium tumefaciens]QCL77841.1 flagellin [Agrobacterium tumefaciens]CUX21704.1 Flagellin B [Agrobacterium sp. NCPPB 925]